MADRRPNRPPVKFREGCMIFGNTTLGHSSVKFRPRRRQQAQPQPAVLEDAEEAPNVTPDAPLEIDPDVLYRAQQIFMILNSSGVVAPAGTPEQ
ncbi:unnamed protein product, partial [Symbiodinium sp. CCMP2456]